MNAIEIERIDESSFSVTKHTRIGQALDEMDALLALLDGSEELASGQRANVAVEVAGEGDSQSNNHSRQAVQ